jgi:hypothetical protein
MADVTVEQAHWIPPEVAMPIGAHYAHVVLSQDGAVNGVLKVANHAGNVCEQLVAPSRGGPCWLHRRRFPRVVGQLAGGRSASP